MSRIIEHGWRHIESGYPPALISVLVLRKTGEMCVAYWNGLEAYNQFVGDDCDWKIMLEDMNHAPENKCE